jgi:chitinase
MSQRFPGRKLSIPRVSLVVVVLAGLVFAGFQGWRWFDDSTSVTTKSWAAGYVDVTATPSYAFESPAATANKNAVLSFIVADKTDACTPSWGTFYTMDEAGVSLDLDRRVARLKQQGGDVLVSFGGQLNDELATACADPVKLKAAYEAVIDRYSLRTIDVDVEGANLSNTESGERRAQVLAEIQRERAGTTSPLAIWLTLPIAPTGLTTEGTDAVTQMLTAGVDLAGVNAMTMDYGDALPKGDSMFTGTENALKALHNQLRVIYLRLDIELGPIALWSKIGATPMIGQNDVAAEVFTLDDAQQLNTFAIQNGIGRVSMWSLNRDTTCGSNYADLTKVSDSCSGIDQGNLKFATVLGNEFNGSPDDQSGNVTTTEPSAVPTPVADDPATSPYPIWSPTASYPKGTKIVWHGFVYVAKYWTQGDIPDNPVLQASETPWELVGPVLPGETPVAIPTLPPGTYTEWVGTTIYTKGERVQFDGGSYEAKWWTQGDSPQAAGENPDSSPWHRLTDNEIRSILGEAPVTDGPQ